VDADVEAELGDYCYYTICTCQICCKAEILGADRLGLHAGDPAAIHNSPR